MLAPSSSIRVGPARLCLRRRFLACLDMRSPAEGIAPQARRRARAHARTRACAALTGAHIALAVYAPCRHMNPDTAEMAIVDPAVVRAQLAARAAGAQAAAESAAANGRWRRDGRSGAARGRRRACAEVRGACCRTDCSRACVCQIRRGRRRCVTAWRALWVSRLLVWVAGVGAVAALGFGPVRNAFNPPGVTHGFGWLGNLLAAPAARWDAAWYLVIAHYGYRPELGSFTSSRDAFFPLYPLGVSALTHVGVQPVLAGVLVSLLAFGLALYGIHRLTTLELGSTLRRGGADVARLTVLVTALAPMAFFFSAVYSESLYLALSVGVFLCARRGRWVWVGVLGALAAATRSAGVVLLAPALLLYLYGPREDSAPAFAPGGSLAAGAARACARVRAWVRPRYRLAPRHPVAGADASRPGRVHGLPVAGGR